MSSLLSPGSPVKRFSQFLLQSIIVLTSTGSGTTIATTLHVTGKVSLQHVKSDGTTLSGGGATFAVTVRSNLWTIRSEPLNRPERQTSDEYWFDGQLLYHLTRWIPQTPPGPELRQNNLGHAEVQVHIFEDKVPPFHPTSMFFPVWLAYASPAYLSKEGDLIPNIAQVSYEVHSFPDVRFRLTRVVSRLRSISGFMIPEEIEFFNTGKYLKPQLPGNSNVGLPKTEPQCISLKPPFDKGFLECRYRVIQSKDNGDGTLPSSAALEVFMPTLDTNALPPISSARVVPYLNIHVDATTYALSDDSFVFQPGLEKGKTALVWDHRTLISGEVMRYVTTNGFLSDISDTKYVNLTNKISAYRKLAESKKRANLLSHPRTRYFALGLLLMLPIIGCLWTISETRKRQAPK